MHFWLLGYFGAFHFSCQMKVGVDIKDIFAGFIWPFQFAGPILAKSRPFRRRIMPQKCNKML